MTKKDLYERYCKENPLIGGHRKITYEQQLEKQVSYLFDTINWIDCKEQKPDEEGIYFIYPNKYYDKAEYCNCGKWFHEDEYGDKFELYVTHWRRIPLPPVV